MERLAGLRRRRMLTQFELAQAVGVAPQSIRNWEAGKTWPRSPTLRRLCTALDVSVDELLTADEQARVFGGPENGEQGNAAA
jgi:transcriptional regulator with XRE-family HTH domain